MHHLAHRRAALLGPSWVAIPALGGALCALVVPGASTTATAGATVLAVGALALLAGHTWGLLVVVPSHLTLVGRLWPMLALSSPSQSPPGGDLEAFAISMVLVTALPGLVLAATLLPRITALVLVDRSPRVQSLVVAATAMLLAAALILPAL
ncbi:MAG: hypothetical protein HY698_08585 [Deltaproteobacteria bacterium]|nr:hypothetical protein [Deltaproteobacteria bacterium]